MHALKLDSKALGTMASSRPDKVTFECACDTAGTATMRNRSTALEAMQAVIATHAETGKDLKLSQVEQNRREMAAQAARLTSAQKMEGLHSLLP